MTAITKKEFTDLITSNVSIFMGVTKELFDTMYIANCVDDYLGSTLVERRTARKNGCYIEFSGGSKLNLTNNHNGLYTVYKYDFYNSIVLIVNQKWYDSFDEQWYDKYMYYLIKK